MEDLASFLVSHLLNPMDGDTERARELARQVLAARNVDHDAGDVLSALLSHVRDNRDSQEVDPSKLTDRQVRV